MVTILSNVYKQPNKTKETDLILFQTAQDKYSA